MLNGKKFLFLYLIVNVGNLIFRVLLHYYARKGYHPFRVYWLPSISPCWSLISQNFINKCILFLQILFCCNKSKFKEKGLFFFKEIGFSTSDCQIILVTYFIFYLKIGDVLKYSSNQYKRGWHAEKHGKPTKSYIWAIWVYNFNITFQAHAY